MTELQQPDLRVKWTDERMARLRELYEKGWSFSVIAHDLGDGLTRNAVIGKAHRFGLNARKIDGNTERRALTAGRPAQPRTKHNITKLLAIAAGEHGDEATTLAPTMAASPVTFFELRSEHCRWPVSGEGVHTVFCGGQATAPLSYCPAHCRLAYRTEPRGQAKRTVWKFRGAA
jgi:GcrA cell cycle regulator